ncbi:conserved Plasmodium protein, unknown function [Plasmodium gallinaceum]|uniref:Cilia- and flagella-associated protein 61 N-terminal domain-containing protein n=1 Tax=Plasmodium gallinaceum TaxID=5849 RepID=A0A1J1GWR4_PLAGA|nr:conserved Plasmodium protein, unknown function [Plasmodium gallinaceum]CRG96995.1 conserved Plasmodium protein, unknown function [Plasmodium gallinaceum]
MDYTFKFYKHKHLMLLKDKLQDIEKYIIYSLDKINEKEEIGNSEENKKKKINDSFSDLSKEIYNKIINIIQYSSICITVFEKKKKDNNEKEENILGITSLDYELSLNSCQYNEKKPFNLKEFYYFLSLHIKNYNILSNLNCNNTLIINLIINKNEKYYNSLFYYLFHSFEDLVFILIFLKEECKLIYEEFQDGLIIDVNQFSNVNIPFKKVIILNKYSFVNKIFLRLTCSSDIYDLHELFKKYSYNNFEETTQYLIYDIIEKKTNDDILITILNNKKKIIGFISLKKNIDINILVNLYNLKDYNYLIKDDFFADITQSLKSYKYGNKNLNKKKKKYLYIEFKQYILKKIKIESLEDLEKNYEVNKQIIYEYLNEHLIEDIEIYADYFIKKNLDTKIIIKNIYNKLQYDYENYRKDTDNNDMNFFLLNKLINLYANISFSDIVKVSEKFYNNFDKIEKLYFNFNNDKTYKKIYQKIKKKKEGIKSDDGSENNSSKINIIKFNHENDVKKTEKNFKEVINLSYFDVFLLLQNIYPEIFKKNEIILLFLFLDLYELIIIEETTIFDCVSFKLFLDELINIKKNYFICKYKHINWLVNLSNKDKNAFSLNLFILNDKYYNHCKEILLKIEKYYDEVDYIIATNNERGNIPFILNYFNRVKKKRKANTLESLYILNKYTLFLEPLTDYMKLNDIDDVQKLLEEVNHKEKHKINEIILSLKEYCKKKSQSINALEESDNFFIELEFYNINNYYIFVSRCGDRIINITTGSILNNIDFYYKLKIFDFKSIILQNNNDNTKHFLLFFFSSIIIFKYYDKKIIHNILVLTKSCSCHISINNNLFSDVYNHFKFLNRKDNSVSIYKKTSIYEEADNNKIIENGKKNNEKYLILTKQMCLKKYVNIDNNIVFWGLNDVCLSILYKMLINNQYFFNNIILIISYKNKYFYEDKIEENNSLKNFSLESSVMYNKLRNIMIKERIKIIYDNIYNIDRENKKIELNNKNFIYYDYLFICFDKEDITTYSFNLNSYELGKKKNFNFVEKNEDTEYKNEKYDFLIKAKDYEKHENNEKVNESFCKKKKKKKTKIIPKNNSSKEKEYSLSESSKSYESNIYENKKKTKKKSDTTDVEYNECYYKGELHNKIEMKKKCKYEKQKKNDKWKISYDNNNEEKNIEDDNIDIHDSSSYTTLSSNCLPTSETSEMQDIFYEEKKKFKFDEEKKKFKFDEEKNNQRKDISIVSDFIKKKKENERENITTDLHNEDKNLCDEKEDKINVNNNKKKLSNIYSEININNTNVNRNIDGVFSITDPFLEKHFDKNSKYMNIVKNCVNYIILYSNSVDILNMVNFFLKNNIKTYKLIIIYPYTCNRCDEKRMKEDMKETIFNDRTYYNNNNHLKNNYLFSDDSEKKKFYHKNFIFDNIKYVLKKVFFLFHLLKIRIIYGKIVAIKKNKKNRLKYIVVHLCKHKKIDRSLFKTHKFICKNYILIPCRILICSYIFDINNHLYYILNKSSIVYDEKICVNDNFQTNDKYIFSGGELCSFSNKYRISKNNILNHEYYSNFEIGKLVSKKFLKIIIEQCCLSYNIFNSKNKKIKKEVKVNEWKVKEENGKKQEEIKNFNNSIELYKKLKIFKMPLVYFNTLPCDFYFYHFQASIGDLSKYYDSSLIENKNDKQKRILEEIYNVALLTDTLKISVKKEKNLNDYFNVKYFEISKNIDIEGYYCKITTNSFNLINSFTYLGCEKLNFHNLHKLCNMSINYFYAILKNIKNNPHYDILNLLNEEREKSIFHYKFQFFKEELKNKVINLPQIKESINLLLKDINDVNSFKKYIKEELFRDSDNFLTNSIKKKVEDYLIEYIKENNELLNAYYLPN